MIVWSALAATATVLLMAALAGPALSGLPEPVLTKGQAKTAYADLPTTRFVAACALLAGVGVLVPAATLPDAVPPMWWVLAGPTLLLAAVDARTTWTPAAAATRRCDRDDNGRGADLRLGLRTRSCSRGRCWARPRRSCCSCCCGT